MEAPVSADKLRFLIYRFKERLWVKPLTFCLLSIVAVFLAKLIDGTSLAEHLPVIEQSSVETLLSIMASSMLVIATFSTGTMVNAYTSASNSSTPRSVSLIIADDVSQNALSTFVGAFIFSVVAITSLKNAFYGDAGVFSLFVLTGTVFAIVILTFIRWVDSIARLGRVGSTIQKVEGAAMKAIDHRLKNPCLGGFVQPNLTALKEQGAEPIYCEQTGYVQLVDMTKAQHWCEHHNACLHVLVLPGDFVSPQDPVALIERTVTHPNNDKAPFEKSATATCDVNDIIKIGPERSFEGDPRFGLIVLGEIAARALSPSINDPGTAISIIGSYVRLFLQWSNKDNFRDKPANEVIKFTHVSAPELSTKDMFNDAFSPIARDGANIIEVALRMQKALQIIAKCKNTDIQKYAEEQARIAYKKSINTFQFDEDKLRLDKARWVK
jgi:uncharacterized membrane protein